MGPPTTTYEVYATVIQAQYDLDLFGAIRRANEAASAHLEVSHFEWQAAQQTLAANIVATVIRSAALRQQIQACQDGIAAARKQFDWAARRQQLGALSRTDLSDAERAYQDAAQQLPVLQAQWQRTHHALAVLLGRAPQDAPADLDFATLHLPDPVPVDVPSELVHRRPDIRVAEASVHEASARLGQATANLYPQIRLSASYGSESFTAEQFLQDSTNVWRLAGGLVQPLFQGGALHAQKDAAQSALNSATERYRGTVLRAFQNVADALRTLEADAQVLSALDTSRQAAFSALNDTRRRAALGATHAGELARREAQWQQENVRWIGASSTRLIDSVALFQATGAPVRPD
jgi:NodT family efflux transporter outer membrane factor (OMF) lipoprotein